MGKIVELKPQEIKKCYCLWDIEGKQNRLYDEISEGKRKMFVYTESEILVGGGSIVFDNGDINRTIPSKRAYLSYLVVREEFRNRGIGIMLIDFITEYAHQLGITELTINVEHSNLRAKKLYLKKGFDETILEKSDTILLLKRL